MLAVLVCALPNPGGAKPVPAAGEIRLNCREREQHNHRPAGVNGPRTAITCARAIRPEPPPKRSSKWLRISVPKLEAPPIFG
jgi:hypothetical protein